MKSSDDLKNDHKLIHRMLSVVDTAINKLKKGEGLPQDFMPDAVEFFREFADKYHFGKEEGMLFEEMEAAGVFTQKLPIESIRHDHYVGRAYMNKLCEIAGRCNDDFQNCRDELIENLEGFSEHILSHSRRENRVLYPLGDALISEERDRKLMEYYRQIDKRFSGYREKYTEVVERLERQLKHD